MLTYKSLSGNILFDTISEGWSGRERICVLLPKGNRLRERFVKEKGRILSFTVQLEGLFEQQWKPIVRYDTAHGFAHIHILHSDGSAKRIAVPVPDFNTALSFAQRDIKNNWEQYRETFEKEAK